jgi:DNA-binding MurR/RpiR family transcriptional regulator
MKEGFSSFLHSDFPTIEAQLDAVLPELSRLEAQVAQYMRLHISDLSFETGASLAQKVGVSEVTISRFLKRLGYEGMRGLKRELRSQLNSRSSATDVGGDGKSWALPAKVLNSRGI